MKTTMYLMLFGIAALFVGSDANAQANRAGTYYSTETTYNCATGYTCYVRFPQLPTDMHVMFQKVHCSVRRSLPLRSIYLGTTDGPTDNNFKRRVTLQAALHSTTDVNNYVVVNDVQFLVGKGKYINLFIDTSQPDSGFVSCQLIGKLLSNLPSD